MLTLDEQAKLTVAESRRRLSRREENRLEWIDFHHAQAARLRHTMGELVAFHEAKAAALEQEQAS